jgi:hypothetical protein
MDSVIGRMAAIYWNGTDLEEEVCMATMESLYFILEQSNF